MVPAEWVIFLALSCTAFANFDPKSHRNWGTLNHEECGNQMEARIIGGSNASIGEFPWIARVGYIFDSTGVTYRCGGAIINPSTVLTAAHCVTGLPSHVKVAAVQVGEYDTTTDPDCTPNFCADPAQVIKPKEIIVHSNYNKMPYKDDIAIIRLADPMTLNPYVSPICLMHGSLMTKDYVGEEAQLAGWGIYDLDFEKNHEILQKITLPISDQALCKKTYAAMAPIGPTQMCAGGQVGKDSCGGDSGGPLTQVAAEGGFPHAYLIGVVSFGARRCGQKPVPGVYTRMSHYMEWLLDNLESNTVDYQIEN